MLTLVCSLKYRLQLALCILKLAMDSNSEILIKFGNRVRKLRKLKNLSQEELAFRADVHRTYIGMIERAEKNITLLNIEKMANALEVSINDLFNEDRS